MTLVVGFSWPIGHDNSVAAILDGKLVFAAEEERFTRHKHSVGELPVHSLVKLFQHLKKLGAKPSDVDAFALNWTPRLFSFSYRNSLYVKGLASLEPEIEARGGRSDALLHWLSGADYVYLSRYFLRRAYSLAGASLPADVKIVPVEHHLAHASSAYYFSGMSSALALTVDGSGERDSTVVWRAKGGEFEKVLAMPTWNSSIGLFYEAMSSRIGYDALEGPGKLMGLAPYGRESKIYARVRSLVKINEDGGGDSPYTFVHPPIRSGPRTLPNQYVSTATQTLEKVSWDTRGEVSREAADIAWATQKVTEEAMLATARWAKRNVSESRLLLAGGVALNAKSNMELFYSGLFEDIFVFPDANDAGGPIGAAAYVYAHTLSGKMAHGRLTNVYLGPEYSEEEVASTVRDSKWSAERLGDSMDEVARLVAKGKVVTVFKGRSELGPRALGDRSIVADPTKKETWRLVNAIKGREWWRPLAPSLLDAQRYFVQARPHEFMVMMYRLLEGASERVPAVAHVDGTARPQTVDGKDNAAWYDLIRSFGELSGEPLVVNTSFNLAGEPLVETPREALRSFAVGGFDALYLDGYLIMKR